MSAFDEAREARPGKDEFDGDGTPKIQPMRSPEDGDDRHQRMAQHMAQLDAAQQALAQQQHEILLRRLQHGDARHARTSAVPPRPMVRTGQISACQVRGTRDRQPAELDREERE